MKSLKLTSSFPGEARTETRSVKTLREYSSHINYEEYDALSTPKCGVVQKIERINLLLIHKPCFFITFKAVKKKAAK